MNYFTDIMKQFTLEMADIIKISDTFAAELNLPKEQSDLKMLSSYLSYPTSLSIGNYLALDLGGSNVRVSLIALYGNKNYTILKSIKKPLKLSGQYNYLDKTATGSELFNFIATMIKEIITEGEQYYLGHTFSFPFTQTNIDEAYLIEWTKEFKTKAVEGQNVTALLVTALNKLGIFNVEPVAVINDTVATFLAAAYTNNNVIIGSICGTGHNTACLIGDTIFNLESGNFSKIPLNKYDEQFNLLTEKPKKQLLEKLSAGRYLGEVVRTVLLDLVDNNVFNSTTEAKLILKEPYIINTEFISTILNSGCSNTNKIFAKINISFKDQYQKEIFELVKQIVIRAASLVAATYLGIIKNNSSNTKNDLVIAVDGSLYEKMPFYSETITKIILAEKKSNRINNNITVVFENRGSELGAAIAAAIVKNNSH